MATIGEEYHHLDFGFQCQYWEMARSRGPEANASTSLKLAFGRTPVLRPARAIALSAVP